jgi:cell wall assembly regulator SMI1
VRTVAKSWQVIEGVLRENANSVFRALRKPASSADLKRLAADLPRRLPDDFLRSLEIHDGLEASANVTLFDNMALTPVTAIVNHRQFEREVQALHGFKGGRAPKHRAVKHDLRWREGWVPFMHSEGDMMLIDLDPGPDGRVGQVVRYYNFELVRPVVAPSFRAWLSGLADRLAARQFKLSEIGGIWLNDLTFTYPRR